MPKLPRPVFEYLPPPPDTSTGIIRVSGTILAQITDIARKCRLPVRAVADQLLAYALANAEVREAKLHDLVLPDDDQEEA